MKAMVLAAGKGSRLGELTLDCPKSLLDLGGTTILHHILENLARHGFHEIVINLHHHGEQIRERFGQASSWGQKLHYLDEEELLGTAGSVKNAEVLFKGEASFLVHYGDLVTNQDLGELMDFHRRAHAEATLLVHQRAHSNSVVECSEDGRILKLWERPSPEKEARLRSRSPWVNSGIYILGPSFFQALPKVAFADIPKDVLPPMIQRGRVYALPLAGYRVAVDSPERLEEARRCVASGGSRPSPG